MSSSVTKIQKAQERKQLRDENAMLKAKVKQLAVAMRTLQSQLNGSISERQHMLAALSKFVPAGIALDANAQDPQWQNIVFLELPTGQGVWHIHDSDLPLFAHLKPYAGQYDGHDFAVKYQRLDALVAKGSIITL